MFGELTPHSFAMVRVADKSPLLLPLYCICSSIKTPRAVKLRDRYGADWPIVHSIMAKGLALSLNPFAFNAIAQLTGWPQGAAKTEPCGNSNQEGSLAKTYKPTRCGRRPGPVVL